jgi:hypothetical protein
MVVLKAIIEESSLAVPGYIRVDKQDVIIHLWKECGRRSWASRLSACLLRALGKDDWPFGHDGPEESAPHYRFAPVLQGTCRRAHAEIRSGVHAKEV